MVVGRQHGGDGPDVCPGVGAQLGGVEFDLDLIVQPAALVTGRHPTGRQHAGDPRPGGQLAGCPAARTSPAGPRGGMGTAAGAAAELTWPGGAGYALGEQVRDTPTVSGWGRTVPTWRGLCFLLVR